MTQKIENLDKSYELLLVIAGSLKESEKKKELEKWEAEITNIGKILDKAIWGNRDLAYKIKAEITGSYLIVHFESQSNQIAELENNLRLDQKVIRHLIYKTPKSYKWREYSDEDLEHDFTKLASIEEDKMKKRFTDKKPVKNEIRSEDKTSVEVNSKEAKSKADVGEIDKKLDDILADL
jgi:small subunit ribosomal protein S6